jgi:hypothetical protein
VTRPARIGVTALLIAAALRPLAAQSGSETLTPAQIALACAAPAIGAAKPTAIRVLGAQDTIAHTILGPQDLLVIAGGSAAGMQLGQRHYIRRASGAYMGSSPAAYQDRRAGFMAATSGWLRIVALNNTTSIARIEYACGAVFAGDYLEPFEAPVVPPDTDRDDSTGELDFTSLSRVVSGPENHMSAAQGEYVVIDRGADQGIAPGARLAIYRDLRVRAMPLMALGEAVVVSAAKGAAVVRINRARDAVLIGDYLVPRKTTLKSQGSSLTGHAAFEP